MFEFAENVFTAESWVRFFGFRIQTRMAALRLAGDRLFLYSPVPLDESLRRELDALGRVAFIVSPNKLHNQTLAAWRAAYPGAVLCVPPGLPERRPALAFDRLLSAQTAAVFGPELEQRLTRGNAFFSEAVFFHRASRTLLVGDLVENLGPGTVSRLALALMRPFGVRQRPMASPEFRFYSLDPRALASSLAEIEAWPFERIFLCHGSLIERDARRVFAEVRAELVGACAARRAPTRWLLQRVARWQ